MKTDSSLFSIPILLRTCFSTQGNPCSLSPIPYPLFPIPYLQIERSAQDNAEIIDWIGYDREEVDTIVDRAQFGLVNYV